MTRSPANVHTLQNPEAESRARFGTAVAGWNIVPASASQEEPEVIVGAPFAHVLASGDRRGKVFAYAFDPVAGFRNVLTARGGGSFLTNAGSATAGAQDHFGSAVAHVKNFDGLSLSEIAAGAPGVDLPNDCQGGTVPDNGAVYVFSIELCP